MTGHGCPECGAERGVDGRPGCACAERAAETLHAERAAEAAAAEDFDPLRIRPYVMLPNSPEGPPHAPEAVSEQTMRLGAVPAEEAPAADPGHPSPAVAPRKRRRLAALTIGAAAAVVVGTAAFASTLFAGDATPKQALPDVADTGVPYSGTDSASADAPSAVPSRTRKAAPSRSPPHGPRRRRPRPSRRRRPRRSPRPHHPPPRPGRPRTPPTAIRSRRRRARRCGAETAGPRCSNSRSGSASWGSTPLPRTAASGPGRSVRCATSSRTRASTATLPASTARRPAAPWSR